MKALRIKQVLLDEIARLTRLHDIISDSGCKLEPDDMRDLRRVVNRRALESLYEEVMVDCLLGYEPALLKERAMRIFDDQMI